ncbi:conserved Plasmodium protein, unknown function [Plasmodium ovale]|nr:conserved Plasmodium protein, unknown function [Plasmodium ovale]
MKIQISHMSRNKGNSRISLNPSKRQTSLLPFSEEVDCEAITSGNMANVLWDERDENHAQEGTNSSEHSYVEILQRDNATEISYPTRGEENLMLVRTPLRTFTHVKKLYFFASRRENKGYLAQMSNENLLKLCIFMNMKKLRSLSLEEEFLRRVSCTSSEDIERENNFPIDEHNFLYIFEFIHHIGLNNLHAVRKSENNGGGKNWDFGQLQAVYTSLFDSLTNRVVLRKDKVIELFSINDRYLYFSKPLFAYVDSTISTNFRTLSEDDITYICKHLNKMMFCFSLLQSGISINQDVLRLVKRYVCKSIVFAGILYPHRGINVEEPNNLVNIINWDEREKIANSEGKYETVFQPGGEKLRDNLSTKFSNTEIKSYDDFQDIIKRSTFVRTLNRELRKCIHEYKYYNLIDIFEFYTLLKVRNDSMLRRFINETEKYVNIMQYGYHAKALILFSLNIHNMEEENKKTVRKLIRRISYMLSFYWPIEFIIETIIACSYFSCKDKIYKNLFLYLKNNIKKCTHPVVLINLLKSMASIKKMNFIIFHQTINYVKKNMNTVHINYIVYILKYMSIQNYRNFSFFLSFLSHEMVFSKICQLPNEGLVNFLYIIFHYSQLLEERGAGTVTINNVIVKSNLSIFYTEYVFFLLLLRGDSKLHDIRNITKMSNVRETIESSNNWRKGDSDESEFSQSGEEETAEHKQNPNLSSPLDVNTFVFLLKICTNMKITNLNILHYSLNFVHNNLNIFNESHIAILFQFFSEHAINFVSSLGDRTTRTMYSYLLAIMRNNIVKIPDHHLPHSTFAIISFYFAEIVLSNRTSNTDLLENMMSMCCSKMRGAKKLLTDENEEKKASYELLNIISEVLQKLYVKMERRIPDELFNFCKHVKREYSDIKENIKNENIRTSEQFVCFFSDLFRNKKINHFVKFLSYPYTIDIVIPNGDIQNLCSQKKAIFVIDKLDNLYLKNVQMTDFFEDYFLAKKGIVSETWKGEKKVYENETTACLKPYESIREWLLTRRNFSVSYMSISEWQKAYV